MSGGLGELGVIAHASQKQVNAAFRRFAEGDGAD